jgi:ABC-2 type transport system permease protein
MLTPERVAFGRIKNNAGFQYRAWKMAVDWVVALYIVVPALIVLGYQYIHWWKEMPVWLEGVPYTVFRVYLFVAAISGTIRYYVDEADQLFLIQRQTWFRRLKATGAAFSLTANAVVLALIAMLLYPLLHNGYGVSGLETAFLFLATYLVKIYLMLGKQQLEMLVSGWRSVAVRLVLTPVLGAGFGVMTAYVTKGILPAVIIILCLAAPLLWLVPARIRARGTFYRDAQREREEKMKLAGMLMSAAGYRAPRKSKAKKKRPFLFPASRKLFKDRSQENILAESLIKGILRSSSKLKLCGFALLAYTTAVVVCPNGTIRLIVLLAVSALFAWMAKAFAKEAATEGYVLLFPWKDTVRMGAFWKAGAGLTMPACAWFGFVYGIMGQDIIMAALMLPMGAAMGWMASRMFGMNGL